MNTPNPPDDSTEAWESAMSRDFDARVRDLHEAPLDLDHVKGKAVTIRRNRRIAVAGGVLAAAAVVTPVAVVAGNGDDGARDPGFVDTPTETTAPDPARPAYLFEDTWFRSDGTEVEVPDREYDAALLWNGHLVATRYDGEAYFVTDVIDADGNVVDSFDTTGAPAINEAGTTIAWIDTDGTVLTRWADGEVAIGEVDLGAPGETIGYDVAAITGGPECDDEAGGCTTYLNSGLDGVETLDSRGGGDSPVEGMNKVFDATEDGTVSATEEVTDDLTACGGLYDLSEGDFRWQTCDHQTQELSPGGDYVVGIPSQGDGQGPLAISVLSADDGAETGRWAADGAFVGHWAWVDGDTLAFTAHDGANWHLYTMEADGELEELMVVEAADMDFPFVLVER
ncbi:MAG TPA: hypothetical protein VD859_13730 [Nocardioides sp.]|nr:hypothetical protein [Nocardioides sp.]